MRLIVPRFALALLVSAVASIPLARADAGDDQFALAAAEYGKQHWQAACDQFAKLLAANPAHPLANSTRFYYGEALAQLGLHAEARTQFTELLKREPQNRFARQALFRSGEAAYLAGDDGAARHDLEMFLEQYPNDELQAYALPYLAQVEFVEGKATAAQSLFAKALAQFENWPLADECRLGLAQCLAELHEVQQATDAYRQLIADHGRLADQALLHLGTLENTSGEYQAALKTFEQLAEEFPDSRIRDKALLACGYSLHKLGRDAEAEKTLQPLLNHPQFQVDAHYWLGLSQMATKQWSKATQTFAAGGRIDEQHRLNPAMGLHAAQAMLNDGQYQQALDEFSRVLTTWPKSDVADECARGRIQVCNRQNEVAEAAFTAGNLPLATDLFAELVRGQSDPTFISKGLSGLGWCQFKAGKWSEAAATFERLQTEFPGSPHAAEAALAGGKALEQLGQSDSALARYDVVIRNYSTSDRMAEALWSAARLYEKLEQVPRACRLYEQLVDDHPDFTEFDAALYRWAMLLQASNQNEAAQALFARLHHDLPQSRYAPDAALRMAEHTLSNHNYDEAEKLLGEITSAEMPDAVRQHAWYLQGRLAMARQHWSEVDAPLAQLIEKFPDGDLVIPASYMSAEASYRQGKYEEAAKRLTDLSEKTAGQPQSWSAAVELRRAQAWAQLKDWDKSLEIARAIETRFPDFNEQYEVDYLIGRSLAAQADFAAARQSYAKVLESSRGGKTQTAAMARWMIGESYFHQENYSAALAEYLQVAQCSFPRWQSAGLLQAGKCHEFLGQWNQAVDVYERLSSTFPTSEFSEEAIRRAIAARQHTTSGSSQLK